MKAVVLWGTELNHANNSALLTAPDAPVIMIESWQVCQAHRYHKQKLVLVLSAMRSFRDELRQAGRTVYYHELTTEDLSDSQPLRHKANVDPYARVSPQVIGKPKHTAATPSDWYGVLAGMCTQYSVDQLVVMRNNDRQPQYRLESWCRQRSVQLETTPNTLFLTPQSLFNEWAESHKRAQMEVFYRWQRKRLQILVEPKQRPDGSPHSKELQPTGGSWNYDAENRQPLPKNAVLPILQFPDPTSHTTAVIKIIAQYFADNPGSLETWWLPTTREQALAWLTQFLNQRFGQFGKYEDAMRAGEPFMYHSALSALLNLGLLHPQEVVDAALATDAPLASKEGFIRQIIGWREFMHGLYHYKPLDWKTANVLNQRKKLEKYWWDLDADTAPEPPLRDVLKRVKQYGYAHHIERLMVLGNYMLLAGYDPAEVYEWFLCMFVDGYEWVMVPNVIGMSQYADGGLDTGGFATKPYISGSNYLQKMGKWWPTGQLAKQSSYTDLYWDFLDRHRDILQTNHRLRPLYYGPNAVRMTTISTNKLRSS